jgi:glycosyltransferase involved in cell wall biosynthesis
MAWTILTLANVALCSPRVLTKLFLERIGILGKITRSFDRCCDGLLWLLVEISKPILMTITRMRSGQVQRSLWTGTPIINMAVSARAERLIGVEADSLVLSSYFVTDEFTLNLSRWNRGPLLWKRILLPFAVLMWACGRYQRFHLFCDRGLLPTRDFHFNDSELCLLHLLGKEIFFYAYGADVRTRRRTEALGVHHCCTECPNPGAACICDDSKGKKLQEKLVNKATAIFSMGDMIHYTPGSRNDLFYWPIDLDRDGGERYAPRYPGVESDKPIRIVHAPNHRGFKGTHFLIETVERLQREGMPIELVLVERIPNRLALDIYRTADIIFDQCLIGFHGYFALEALAIGKPVMVFIRDPENYLIKPDECPFINTPVEKLEFNLRMLTRNRRVLCELGKQGRHYIEKYHSLPAFAARLRRVYQEIQENKLAGKSGSASFNQQRQQTTPNEKVGNYRCAG